MEGGMSYTRHPEHYEEHGLFCEEEMELDAFGDSYPTGRFRVWPQREPPVDPITTRKGHLEKLGPHHYIYRWDE